MRILHVADFVSEKLGYQEFLLAKWNARHGHEVHVVTSDRNPPAVDYLSQFEPLLGPRVMKPGTTEIEGVLIHRLPGAFEMRTRILLRGLTSECERLRPDAVLCHGSMSPTAITMARYAGKTQVPVFMDNHMVFQVQDRSALGRASYAGARILMHRYMADRVAGFYGVAEECCQFLISAQGAPPNRVSLLPLGVDTDLFKRSQEAASALRETWGIAEEARVVGQTGKLDQTKDPLLLAQAVSPLMQLDPTLHCVMVGSGPKEYIAEIEQEFRNRGVLDRFHLKPAVTVDRLAGVFSALDVVVYPGATSMSSIEAAACGTVVLMNSLPTSKWRAEQGLGSTFETHNAADLQGKLIVLLRMSQRERELLGRRAQLSAITQFSYDAVARKLEEDMWRACRGQVGS